MDYLTYIRAIHGSTGGKTRKDATINNAKAQLERELQSSVNYVSDSTRNGVVQRFVVTPTNTRYKYNIEAFPDEQLYAGDVIECFGETWIVIETSVANPIQITGTMWLCNHKFRFQNHSSKIIERWGVLDSGVFSTTKKGNEELQYKDVQYKIFLPLDEDTSKMYIDKRLATSTITYNEFGDPILDVYSITRVDPISRNYGKGSHLLVLNVRNAANYNKETDNLEEYICDYIAPTGDESENTSGSEVETTIPEMKKYKIEGRAKIPIGGTRIYKAITDDDTVCEWNIQSDIEIESEINGNELKITVPDNDDLVGKTIIICTVGNDNYEPTQFNVEVTA